MSHKAGGEFFDKKRDWSKRKDQILGSYLPAYLAKVSRLGYPILIVDGFAGPGRFGGGENGSPLIISRVISEHLEKNLSRPVDVSLLCIEQDASHVAQLQNNLKDFSYVEIKQGRFTEVLPEISRRTDRHSVFLYVDPFTVEGIIWRDLEDVFKQLQDGWSVEILMNFNVFSFVRRGRAALKLTVPPDDNGEVSTEKPTDIENLNQIAGGLWWQDILSKEQTDDRSVNWYSRLNQGIRDRLGKYFRGVCSHDILAEPNHRVPKYTLVFGSRSPDALNLMNDQMAKSLGTLAERALPKVPELFESRSENLVPSLEPLQATLLNHTHNRIKRKALILAVIRDHFGRYENKTIRGEIEEFLKKGILVSSTGRTRINDDVEVYQPLGRSRER